MRDLEMNFGGGAGAVIGNGAAATGGNGKPSAAGSVNAAKSKMIHKKVRACHF